MTAEKAPTDWERVELDYRAGLLSVREIAEARGCSHTAINKRAKKEGWERDLKAKIRAKADALVSRREVSKEVSTQRAETERTVVEVNAQVIADIRMAHRKDIRRARTLCLALLEEMEDQTSNRELYEQLGDMLRSEDQNGVDRRNDLYNKVISSAGRISSTKQLSETLRILVALEREAYGIVSDGAGDEAPPAVTVVELVAPGA